MVLVVMAKAGGEREREGGEVSAGSEGCGYRRV